MPRLPKDFSKGLIYKLCCKDHNVKEVYVGSSTNFVERKKNHKTSCNNPNGKDYNLKVYQFIRANGGWSNWNMVLIEFYPCDNILELGKNEDHWKQELQASLNTNTPPIYENMKEYVEAHRQLYNERSNEYYEVNKEQINKKRNEKITCDCGCIVNRSSMRTHEKTKYHQNYLAEKQNK